MKTSVYNSDMETVAENRQYGYNQAFKYKLNQEKDSMYVLFDNDYRSERVNMQFQHFHDFYEILILLGPKAGHLIEGEYRSLQKFDMVLLKPGKLHQSIYFKGGPVQRIIINFRLPSLPYLAHFQRDIASLFDTEESVLRLNTEDRNTLFTPLSSIAVLENSSIPNKDILILSKIFEFLALLVSMKDHNQFVETEQMDYITGKMFDISSFILSNFTEELSLAYLSSKFNISPCYLSRKFQEVLGFSLVKYVLMARLRNAQKLLLYTTKPVSLVAEESGFNYSAHFNRMFNRYCGFSPLEFRRKALAGEADLINFNFDKKS